MSEDGRYSRQKDIVPPERIAACKATVIGVGAIGRQVALQLAAMGVPWLQLTDFDVVETSNLASQGYLEEDLGKLKVEATAALCKRINAGAEIIPVAERFRRSMEIFCNQSQLQNPAVVLHRMPCICTQAYQYLVNLSGISHHCGITVDICPNFNGRRQRRPHEPDHLFRKEAYLNLPGLNATLTAEGYNLFDNLPCPVRGLQYFPVVVVLFVFFSNVIYRQLGVTDDR